tara:strand:- start:1562 stop:3721 length:2160 start_codon:yes stop_codon:yes gene_type:complete
MKNIYLLIILFCFPFFLLAQIQLGQNIVEEAPGDNFGTSISMSADGNTVAIGAPYNDGNGSWSGHVRVYTYNGSSWFQLGQDIDGEWDNDRSGSSVSLSADGNTVAIGATHNDGNGNLSGHVRVYNFNGSSWNQLGQDIDGEAAVDRSGSSVSISADGNTIAIGAISNDGNGNESGHVRVYIYNGSWVQLGQDIDGENGGDNSGYSVSLSADGNTVAIGAPYNDENGSYSGHVRVYTYNGSWVQLGQDIDGEESGDQSGYSVSLSDDGNTVAIGAPNNDGNGGYSGHVRVYTYNGNSWVQLGQDIDGEWDYDRSGRHVCISADGSRVAIGAPYNDNNNSSSNTGHVRVYTYSDTSWVQLGQDIDGQFTYDGYGRVSMNSDGSIVGIGSPGGGHVAIYSFSNATIACSEDPVTGLFIDGIIDDRVYANFDDMNTYDSATGDQICRVDQIRIQYRPINTSVWSQKTIAYPVGYDSTTGICNSTQATSKAIRNLTLGTTYEWRVKVWYCGGGNGGWVDGPDFTTLLECPNVANFTAYGASSTKATFDWDASNGVYDFVRIKLRVDSIQNATGSDWMLAGGFGVYYPTNTKNKNGLIPGVTYRGQARTWCDPNGGAYNSLSWTPIVTWTQPTNRIEGGTEITNLDVYPIPSRDVFNIAFTSDKVQDIRVRIFNVVGEEIMNEDLQRFIGEYTKKINLKDNTKGIYFLEIVTNKGLINKKLILQ